MTSTLAPTMSPVRLRVLREQQHKERTNQAADDLEPEERRRRPARHEASVSKHRPPQTATVSTPEDEERAFTARCRWARSPASDAISSRRSRTGAPSAPACASRSASSESMAEATKSGAKQWPSTSPLSNSIENQAVTECTRNGAGQGWTDTAWSCRHGACSPGTAR